MRTITMCGSSRFTAEFKTCARLLGQLGVATHGLSSYRDDFSQDKFLSPVTKEIVDLLHLAKVRDADIILVLDVNFEPPFDTEMRRLDAPMAEQKGYIGYSTAREIFYASMEDRPVAFLSDLLSANTSIEEAMTELAKINPFEIPAMEVDVAKQLLELAIGRQTVADQQIDTSRDTMHAVLSDIAGSEDPQGIGEMAAEALSFLGLVVMPPALREPYLKMIGGGIGAEGDRGG